VTPPPEALLPVLVHIQANLDEDLSLATLSRIANLSPSHFHRVFNAGIGETPSQYVARLRLERGAFRLQVQNANILRIALDCGFNSHETFTRAFQRAFGKSPAAYRDWSRQQLSGGRTHARTSGPAVQPTFGLSATKVVRLRDMHLAFVRHLGPYEEVPDFLFSQLAEWAERSHVPGPRIWLGIGHDAPGTTAPEQLRFDAALVVPGAFAQDGHVGHQLLVGGDFAVTTHVGAYDTLPCAYSAIFGRVVSLAGYELVGLPAVEFYRTGSCNSALRLNETDICLPVERRSR